MVGVEQDPDVSAALDPNGTAQLALPRLALPLGASRPPPLPPQSGPEAARFSRKCQQSPAQLSTLRIMLWVTTAYFFLPLLCLSGLIGQELWSSRGPLRGPAASGREKGHRQTVRVLRKWGRLCSKDTNRWSRLRPLPLLSQP